MKTKIKHPNADAISVIYEYNGEEDVREIAFFLKGKWVTEPIEPFTDYFEQGQDTAVYRYVPLNLVNAFLEEKMV